jgi:capsular exopolysaccharide synthesis family protein
VGRIDEALKRTTAGGANETPASSGQLFKPAWTVTDAAADAAEPRPEDTSALAPPVAGAEPAGMVRFSSQWRERLAAGPDSDVGLTEQFRRLAATLHHAHQANGLRDVMLTSAAPGDGKTLTAVNLALVLAESYRYRVLLIDADLRRPSIPNVVDLTEGSGLSEALIAPTEQKLALVPITARLTLLPAGRPIANSIEALTSPRMRQILEEAASRFDWIILDAPPVGPATDARLLAQMVGGTLFVIHAGQTQSPDVQKAIDAIGREQILGVVLNGVEDAGADAYYYGSPRD